MCKGLRFTMLIIKALINDRDNLIDYIDYLKARGLDYTEEVLELEKLELSILQINKSQLSL